MSEPTTDHLFDIPKTAPRRRDMTRAARARQVADWKQRWGIQTHLCRDGGEWMAVSMPECVSLLDGYDLTGAEKTELSALMAGYCRLLDEANVVEEHHATEYSACLALVVRLEAKP